jgi:predicted DsbA family dithiol-disulfide isomerase
MNRPTTIVLLVMLAWSSLIMSQQKLNPKITKDIPVMDTTPVFTVEIWSDIVCPFCYLGKRKFEEALAQFENADQVRVVWKSFQLNPDVMTDTSISVYQHLSRSKGITEEVARQMAEGVTQRAKEAGLNYDFDKAVVANTYRAHCLLHLAKEHGMQNTMKERLLKAYFIEGMNVDDPDVLVKLGTEVGLNAQEISEKLSSDAFRPEVEEDMDLAQRFGIRGVPYFVFDRKYAVSGAQESPVFLQTLERSFEEWKKANPAAELKITEGAQCTPDKKCD